MNLSAKGGTVRTGVSARIRALAAAGHSRAEIARQVDRSYQQVRQVLVADEARARRNDPSWTDMASTGVAEQSQRFGHERGPVLMHGVARIPIAADGSATLPTALVQALMGGKGRTLIGRMTEQGLLLMSPEAALAWVREGIPQWKPGQPLWSDDLIAERRTEAAGDNDG